MLRDPGAHVVRRRRSTGPLPAGGLQPRHNPAEADEIRRWADDLLSGVSMNHVLRDLAARGVPTVRDDR